MRWKMSILVSLLLAGAIVPGVAHADPGDELPTICAFLDHPSIPPQQPVCVTVRVGDR